MNEILYMNGHGIYVWVAYAITLGVFVLNAWLAAVSHRRNLELARQSAGEPEAARRPRVRQMQ